MKRNRVKQVVDDREIDLGAIDQACSSDGTCPVLEWVRLVEEPGGGLCAEASDGYIAARRKVYPPASGASAGLAGFIPREAIRRGRQRGNALVLEAGHAKVITTGYETVFGRLDQGNWPSMDGSLRAPNMEPVIKITLNATLLKRLQDALSEAERPFLELTIYGPTYPVLVKGSCGTGAIMPVSQ